MSASDLFSRISGFKVLFRRGGGALEVLEIFELFLLMHPKTVQNFPMGRGVSKIFQINNLFLALTSKNLEENAIFHIFFLVRMRLLSLPGSTTVSQRHISENRPFFTKTYYFVFKIRHFFLHLVKLFAGCIQQFSFQTDYKTEVILMLRIAIRDEKVSGSRVNIIWVKHDIWFHDFITGITPKILQTQIGSMPEHKFSYTDQ